MMQNKGTDSSTNFLQRTDLEPPLQQKYQKLLSCLRELGSTAVAYSSGVDSTLLVKAAKDALGERVIAVNAAAPSFPARERAEAEAFCKGEGIRLIKVQFDPFSVPGFAENPEDRCYLCKKALFTKIRELAAENGMHTVSEGSNMDDLGDYRPGLKAIRELDIRSPLREAGLTKAEIRALSKKLGLPTWNKPSYACLASRFVYGEKITAEKLGMVERAEQLMLDLGFSQMRVRIHGKMARIEVLPEDFEKIMEEGTRRRIVRELKALGFSYVTLDLQGYRTGSMNETLPNANHS